MMTEQPKQQFNKVKIDLTLDAVTVNGVAVPRPDSVPRSNWQSMWQAAMKYAEELGIAG